MKNFKKILAGTMIATMLLGMTAFAEEATPAATTEAVSPYNYTCNIDVAADTALLANYGKVLTNSFERKDYTANPYYQFARSQIEANIAAGNPYFSVTVYDGRIEDGFDSTDKRNLTLNLFVDILKDYPQYNVWNLSDPVAYFHSTVKMDSDWAAPAGGFGKYVGAFHAVTVLVFTNQGITSQQYYSLPCFDANGDLISTSLYSEPVVYTKVS